MAKLCLLVTVGGCNLYLGGDDDPCTNNADIALVELRNPETGQCELFGGGGGCGATDSDGLEAPVYYGGDWAACDSYCSALDETSCLATDACRAIYRDSADGTTSFAGCWGTAPSGPIRGGDCTLFAAQECSLHDDCVAHHVDDGLGGVGRFASCGFEPVTCGSDPGGGGGQPVPPLLLRDPQTGQCTTGGGDPCGNGDLWWPDWAFCYAYCEGLDEATCQATDACRAAYVDACPECDIATPILDFVECWGTAPSGPIRGTECRGLDAFACSLHDDCSPVHRVGPDGSYGEFVYCTAEPPVEPPPAGCYSDSDCRMGERCNASDVCYPPPGCDPATGDCPAVCYGECVPVDPPPAYCTSDAECGPGTHCNAAEICLPPPDCDPTTGEVCLDVCFGQCVPDEPLPTCEAISDERTCVETGGCAPLYEGYDCHCDATGCGCSSWKFASCQTAR